MFFHSKSLRFIIADQAYSSHWDAVFQNNFEKARLIKDLKYSLREIESIQWKQTECLVQYYSHTIIF